MFDSRRISGLVRRHGIADVLRTALGDPVAVLRYLRRDDYRMLDRNDMEEPPDRATVEAFVPPLLDDPPEAAVGAWFEIRRDREFQERIGSRFRRTAYGPDAFYHSWRELLYVLVRLLRPRTVVETGVRGGFSSAHILRALDRNGHGRLVSIDIGDTSILPPDLEERAIGWQVPDELRERWRLHIGDSTKLLPDVLDDTDPDLLFSDVPNDVLQAELSMATELSPGSIVVTCYPHGSEAQTHWDEFAAEHLGTTTTATRWSSPEDESLLRAGVRRDV